MRSNEVSCFERVSHGGKMIKLTKPIDLEDYTFVIPSVSVGNVSQLAVDLLISSLGLCKIGQVFCPAFVPVVGLDPYDENSEEICTATDVYAGTDEKIVVLQIRSPPVRQLTEFFSEVEKFVKEHKLNKVIILAGSYAYQRKDGQLNVTELRYIASKDLRQEDKTQFEELEWRKHEQPESCESREAVRIPGGGFGRRLYEHLSNSGIPCAILYKFCSEGDNIPDAEELINYLNQWIKLIKTDSNGLCLKHPPSWKYLYGNPPPAEIY